MEKLPIPIDEQGVPVKPTNLVECYEVCYRGAKSQNRHHLAFNRNAYKSPIERGYREAGSMIIKLCECKHSDFHSTYLPPKKPSKETMLDVIQGDYLPTEKEVFIVTRDMINQENIDV